MAAVRAFRPLTQQAVRLTARPTTTSFVTRRALSSPPTGPVLATTHASVTGGRAGHIESENLTLDLSVPKSMGGPGEQGKTNPEELFAAGYGACFQGAMVATAGKMGVKMPKDPKDTIVNCTVQLLGDAKKLDFGIHVDMHVKVKGVDKAEMEKVVEKTKEVCPYSRATRGNVQTDVTVESV